MHDHKKQFATIYIFLLFLLLSIWDLDQKRKSVTPTFRNGLNFFRQIIQP